MGSVVQVKFEIKEEFCNELDVRSVVGQMLIELRRSFTDLGQIVPGASWEIVVFDVVSQVEVEKIPKSEIVVGFHSRHDLEMFGHGVASCRVGSNRD